VFPDSEWSFVAWMRVSSFPFLAPVHVVSFFSSVDADFVALCGEHFLCTVLITVVRTPISLSAVSVEFIVLFTAPAPARRRSNMHTPSFFTLSRVFFGDDWFNSLVVPPFDSLGWRVALSLHVIFSSPSFSCLSASIILSTR